MHGQRELRQAHERLDRAVYAAYGWTYPMEPDEVLSLLLELNASRSAGSVLRV
jgi:hypothetical protein